MLSGTKNIMLGCLKSRLIVTFGVLVLVFIMRMDGDLFESLTIDHGETKARFSAFVQFGDKGSTPTKTSPTMIVPQTSEAITYMAWTATPGEIDSSYTPPKIALCVTGQSGRMLPKELASLFESNPAYYEFTLFYSLQNDGTDMPIYANDARKKIYGASKYVSMNESQVLSDLRDLYKYPNVVVAEVMVKKGLNREEWRSRMDGQDLDRINQYKHYQENILNMYSNYVDCTAMIQRYEASNRNTNNVVNFSFDYIIHSREDIIFFKPLQLAGLLPWIRMSQHSAARCDYLVKDCLAWNGIPLRFSVMSRDVGLRVLASKITFYRSMYENNTQVGGSEAFERLHLASESITACGVSIEKFPATGGRFVKEGEYCLTHVESTFDNCYPKDMRTFVESKQCDRRL